MHQHHSYEDNEHHGRHQHMPHTDHHMQLLKAACMNEFFASPTGQQYKLKYDQAMANLNSVLTEMDIHVCDHFKKKYHHV